MADSIYLPSFPLHIWKHALSRGLHMYRAPEPGLTWSPVIPTAEELKRESERVQQIIRMLDALFYGLVLLGWDWI